MMGLGGFNRATKRCRHDSTTLVRTVQRYADGYFMPIQMEEEIVALMDEIRALQPKVILEIGTHWGGTLHFWTRVAPDDATIISADLPGGKFGGGYSAWKAPLYRSFARAKQSLHLLRVDSHAPETLAAIKALLGERKVDFLFIDGDHTYEGVKQDWELYSPLVRPGGLVAFHDIAKSYDDTQVARFWNELKPSVDAHEFAFHPEKIYGIGVVRL